MKLTGNLSLFLCIGLWLLLLGCSTAKKSPIAQSTTPVFHLIVDRDSIRQSLARVEISVPCRVTTFIAPSHYGGGPPLIQFVRILSAVDSNGKSLPVTLDENKVRVKSGSAETYTLVYSLTIPQKISGDVHTSLPNLDEIHGEFDGNDTFLNPQDIVELPARLRISAPEEWKVATGWGIGREALVPKISQLISGLIVMGDFRYSSLQLGQMKINFAIRGDFSDLSLKEQFSKVFESQQTIAGPLPFSQLLVVMQAAKIDEPHGTALTSALVVNIPPGEKLDPFNFRLVGTMSHELFHQWDLYSVYPATDEGAYLLTEGFANYFGVAALVQARLISETDFARFLRNYRKSLEGNPRYPGADYAAIQIGFAKNIEALRDLAYTKGLFVAILLDLALREDSGGRECLSSWFRELAARFGGKAGYDLSDLRDLTVKLTHKSNGQAVQTFDYAFVGGKALDLNGLFAKLGMDRSFSKGLSRDRLRPDKGRIRAKVFAAEM